jgi:hypothetical protein
MARTDTAGANLDGGHATVSYRLDFLKIRIPYSTGLVVRVADIVAEARPFTTNFTFS